MLVAYLLLFSTYLMLARILRIKGCLASALLNFEKTDIEFTSRDFELMRKVTMIIRFYQEATQMLSEDDCSVFYSQKVSNSTC